MKNAKRNTIFLLIICVIVTFFIMKDNFTEILTCLISVKKRLVIVALLLIVAYWLLRALALYIVVKRYNKKIKYKKMLHQILITQFFNGITPFASGGEPMQIYMLKKSGIKVAQATNIIVQEFIMYQIALIFIGLVVLILNAIFNFCSVDPILFNFIILGFIINISVGLIMIFVSFSKKFSKFLVNLGLKIGVKINLIKDVEKTTKIWNEKVEEYNESGTMLKENKNLFFTCILINFLALIVFYLIPFFVFLSLGHNVGVLEAIVSSAFILIVGNFVPLPGGTVGTEAAFGEFFKKLLPVTVGTAVLNTGLIIWRGITLYLGILVGGIALGFFKGDAKK